MKTMKQTFWFLMMLTALTLTACSKDDDNDNGTQEDDAIEVARIREKLDAELMTNALCSYNAETATYTPRIGEAINAPTPTIYYAIANTVDEARSKFESIVAVTRTDSLDTTPLPNDVTRGDVHLTFAASTAAGETARINVDCPRLAVVLTTIVFIPETAWPENGDLVTPYDFLSCWREKSTGRIYICTRNGFGGSGQMLTFDGGWTDKWFKDKTYWQGEFYQWENTATEEALKGLCDGMLNSPDKFQKMFEQMGKKAGGSRTYNIVKSLYVDRGTLTFDLDFSWDTVWYRFYYYYYVKKNYFTFRRSDNAWWKWTHEYIRDDTPKTGEASHSFAFSRSDGKDNSNWEAIYR